MRQICPGVSELWSDKQTERQIYIRYVNLKVKRLNNYDLNDLKNFRIVSDSYFRIVSDSYFRIVPDSYFRIVSDSYFRIVSDSYFVSKCRWKYDYMNRLSCNE